MSELKTKTIKDVIEECEEIHKSLSKTTCCFTGHRILRHRIAEIKEKVEFLVSRAILKGGYTHFICGGALGFDTIVAEIIIKLRDEMFPYITLEIAVPCLNQDCNWNSSQKAKYAKILKMADKKSIISEKYSQNCMQLRNKYMVNNSSVVIAYFNNKPSGTKNTIDYAIKQCKEIWYI